VIKQNKNSILLLMLKENPTPAMRCEAIQSLSMLSYILIGLMLPFQNFVFVSNVLVFSVFSVISDLCLIREVCGLG